MNKEEKQTLIGALNNLNQRLKELENQNTGGIEIKVDNNNTITIKRLI